MQELPEAREMYPAVLLVMKFGSANYKVASWFLCIALCVCLMVLLYLCSAFCVGCCCVLLVDC